MILLFLRDELLVKNKYAGYYRGKHFFELKKYKTYLACCMSLIKKKKDKIRQRVFLLPTLWRSSNLILHVQINEFIVRPWWFIFNFLVLDFKVLLAPCKGIGNPAKILLVESGIPGFRVRNTVQGIRTPTYD